MGETCYICKHHEDDHGSCGPEEPIYCEMEKCACGGKLVTWDEGMRQELEKVKQERDDAVKTQALYLEKFQSLRNAFDDRVRVIELQLEDKKKLYEKLRKAEAVLTWASELEPGTVWTEYHWRHVLDGLHPPDGD